MADRVALSVGPLILRAPFDPGNVAQFLYLDLCLLTVGWVGWRAIRHRRDLQAFRTRPFAALGWAMAASGALVLAAGLATGDPMAVYFSWIGLVLGGAMIAFARHPGPLHPNWGLSWHLNAMAMLFNAVHGTLAFVLWRHLVDAAAAWPSRSASSSSPSRSPLRCDCTMPAASARP